MQIKLPPCNKFTGNTLDEQSLRILEEAREANKAALADNPDAADEEVMDVIQACITYLAIRGYSQETVDELTARVHEKNRMRGYYEQEGRT